MAVNIFSVLNFCSFLEFNVILRKIFVFFQWKFCDWKFLHASYANFEYNLTVLRLIQTPFVEDSSVIKVFDLNSLFWVLRSNPQNFCGFILKKTTGNFLRNFTCFGGLSNQDFFVSSKFSS